MIQSILILGLVAVATYIGSHRLSGGQTLLVAASALIGIVLVIFPALASELADVMHVGRGTDLVLYILIMFGFFVTANFYFRHKRNEAVVVAIVRELAIRNPRYPTDDEVRSGNASF